MTSFEHFYAKHMGKYCYAFDLQVGGRLVSKGFFGVHLKAILQSNTQIISFPYFIVHNITLFWPPAE